MKRFTLATLAVLISASSILALSPNANAESRERRTVGIIVVVLTIVILRNYNQCTVVATKGATIRIIANVTATI